MSATHKRARVAAGRAKSPAPTRISLLVPRDLKEGLLGLSKSEKRTLNAQCALMLERALEGARSGVG